MNFILDTNILLLSLVSASFDSNFEIKYSRSSNDFIISTVTVGEIKSLAIQRNWGEKKLRSMDEMLSRLIIYPIKVQNIINAYARIDAFSQGKLSEMPLPPGLSARNMGKNDLWIAATAQTIGATLITTDKDFDHLSPAFLKLEWIDAQTYS